MFPSSYDRNRDKGGRNLAFGLLVVAAGTLAIFAASRLQKGGKQRWSGITPRAWQRRAAKRRREPALVGRTVTINRPRQELYAYWRDISKLADFMENVREVTIIDDRRSRWTVKGPGETDVEFETAMTEDRRGELIAWESVENSPIRTSGRIEFRDAPAGRGTHVTATIAYDPPAGRAGQLAAKLFQREPQVQVRRELRRFKQLMETGEIATTEPGPAAPRTA